MEAYALLLACIILPFLLGVTFRVATAHIFFSIMAGELLGRYFGHDIDERLGSKIASYGTNEVGEILLIVMPMLITSIVLKGTLSKGKVLLHSLPLLVTGVILAAFVLPLLPESLQQTIRSVGAGEFLLDKNRIIIGSMIVLQLVWVWIIGRKEKSHDKKHKE